MTPAEAIASIRASLAAGYSPSLSDIEVLIAECGRAEGLEGQLATLQVDADNYRWMIRTGAGAISEPIREMWSKVTLDGRLYPAEEEWHNAITEGRKSALSTQASRNENG